MDYLQDINRELTLPFNQNMNESILTSQRSISLFSYLFGQPKIGKILGKLPVPKSLPHYPIYYCGGYGKP
jgi:hypothetical protein